MGDTNELRIKVATDVEIGALKQLESQLQRQIVQAQALGKPYAEAAQQLGAVQARLAGFGGGDKLKAAFTEAASAIPGASLAMAAFTGGLGAIVSAAGVVTGALNMAKTAINKFAEAQSAITSLDAGLANAGQLTEAYRTKLQALASTQAGMTGKSSTEWVGALATLVKFGADAGNIDKLAESVKNLAGFLGGDLQQAAFLMGKALQGNFTMLSRYGIHVDASADKATKLAQAMNQIEQRGGGQLEAHTKTLSGQFEELSKAVGGFFKGLGIGIANTGLLQGALTALTIPLQCPDQCHGDWIGGSYPGSVCLACRTETESMGKNRQEH